jgi:hypothetical protein
MYDAEQFFHRSATTNSASGLSSHAAYSVSRYCKTFFKHQITVSNWMLFINTAVRVSNWTMMTEEVPPNSIWQVKLIRHE